MICTSLHVPGVGLSGLDLVGEGLQVAASPLVPNLLNHLGDGPEFGTQALYAHALDDGTRIQHQDGALGLLVLQMLLHKRRSAGQLLRLTAAALHISIFQFNLGWRERLRRWLLRSGYDRADWPGSRRDRLARWGGLAQDRRPVPERGGGGLIHGLCRCWRRCWCSVRHVVSEVKKMTICEIRDGIATGSTKKAGNHLK